MNNIYLKKEDIADFDCISSATIDKMGIKKDLISVGELIGIMEDLYFEKERIEEEYEDFKKQVEDNYKPISPYEMYEVSEREF
jgi:hypothetical protein